MRAIAIVVVALAAGPLQAQTSAPRLDFAVPDAPAFMLLEVEAGNILRPTTTRDLAIAFSDFLGSGTSIGLPEAFAMEVAPFLLAEGDRLTIAGYRRAPWKYRLRVSGGTRRAGGGSPSQLAFGVRATVLDGADLRTHPRGDDFQQIAVDLTRRLLDDDAAVRRRLLSEPMFQRGDATRERLDSLRAAREWGPDVPNDSVRARLLRIPRFRPNDITQEMVDEHRTRAQQMREEEVHDSLRAVVQEFQEENWNATVLDVAVAVRASGQDTTGRDLVLDAYAAWLTYGTRVGEWGQFLVGAQAAADRDTATGDFGSRLALSTRLYVGSNFYKLLVEGRADLADGRTPLWVVVAGGEARLPFGAWVTFAAGIAYDGAAREGHLVTNTAMKFDLPSLAGWMP